MSTATSQPAFPLFSVAEQLGALTRRADDALFAAIHRLQPILECCRRLWDAFDRGFGVEQVPSEQLPEEERPGRASGLLQACHALTDDQQLVWNCLNGRFRTAKELANEILEDPKMADAIRKRIQRMRQDGNQVSHKKGRGYYRPDAPPSG